MEAPITQKADHQPRQSGENYKPITGEIPRPVDTLREVSPLLGSRSGLSTAENPMADVAAKLAELVAL